MSNPNLYFPALTRDSTANEIIDQISYIEFMMQIDSGNDHDADWHATHAHNTAMLKDLRELLVIVQAEQANGHGAGLGHMGQQGQVFTDGAGAPPGLPSPSTGAFNAAAPAQNGSDALAYFPFSDLDLAMSSPLDATFDLTSPLDTAFAYQANQRSADSSFGLNHPLQTPQEAASANTFTPTAMAAFNSFPESPAGPVDSPASSYLGSNSAASTPQDSAGSSNHGLTPSSSRKRPRIASTHADLTPASRAFAPPSADFKRQFYNEPAVPFRPHNQAGSFNPVQTPASFPISQFGYRTPSQQHPPRQNSVNMVGAPTVNQVSRFPNDSIFNDSPHQIREEKTHPHAMNLVSTAPTNYIDLTDDDGFDSSLWVPSFNDNTPASRQPVQPPVDLFAADPFLDVNAAYQPGSSARPPTNQYQNSSSFMSERELALFLPSNPSNTQFQNQPPAGPIVVAPPQANNVPSHLNPMPVPRGGPHLNTYGFPDHSGETEPAEVRALIESIRPGEIPPPHLREKTPHGMKSTLMEHQKLALARLKHWEETKHKGGIIADEMGLGKTVEAIALMVARPSDDSICKTTLIVAPLGLMHQWKLELERHVEESHKLSVWTYHDKGKRVDFSTLRKHDVVLTTYGTLGSELRQIDQRQEARAELAEREGGPPRSARKRLALLGDECQWYRVILDEAQCIKNRGTQISKAAHALKSRYRLAMTGTPMMNSVDELYPLIRFLRIKPYSDWITYSAAISKRLKQNDESGMQVLRALLQSVMLRRTKDFVIDGKPICTIPHKETHHEIIEFTKDERELYNALESKTQIQMSKYLRAGNVLNSYASILLLLLRLRQSCCHPHLIKDIGVQVSTESINEADLLSRAGDLVPDVVNRLKGVEDFDCPICLDATVNPTIFLPCGHSCCGECFQQLIDPSNAVQQGNEGAPPRCPECRGPLSSDKITDYKHFLQRWFPEKGIERFGDDAITAAGGESDSQFDDDSDTDSEDEDSDNSSLDGFVVPDDAEDDYEFVTAGNADSTAEAPDGESPNGEALDEEQRKIKKAKGKRPAKPARTLAQLKKESLRSKDAKRRYLRRLRKNFITSSKIDKMMEIVTAIRANDPTEKTLIFSQFTSMLDLIEVPLEKEKFTYVRYDGSMTMNDRADAVSQFMDLPDQNIMLVSLKAGNAGLNLYKASQVIMIDPFWNPFIEDQAVDRAHRMPQKREVHVHRLLVKDTVEDRIILLQDRKRDLISKALNEEAGLSISRLGQDELRFLFGMERRAR